MKILILGGTGAMGIHLIEMLKERHELFITSRSKNEDCDSIKFIQGNAKDINFITRILNNKWDVIIDFMVYGTQEFENRVELLLNGTNHYFFLSSARVFSNTQGVILETSPRLLDNSVDSEYLKTDEYALSKARQENILFELPYQNWTIIRPYITYSENRLQLGVLEKEEWLYRAIKGRGIVFCEDIIDKTTTLTYGEDVAEAISRLIGNDDAKKQSFNISSNKSITWRKVLEIYSEVIKEITGNAPKVILLPLEKFLDCKPYARYQIINDRLFDRKFDNTKIVKFVGQTNWINPEDGLKRCLIHMMKDPLFLKINWHDEITKDKFSNDITPIWEIEGLKNKIYFFLKRFKK